MSETRGRRRVEERDSVFMCVCVCKCVSEPTCALASLSSLFLFLALYAPAAPSQQPKLTVPPFLPLVMSQMALVAPPGKRLQLAEDYGGFPPVGAPCHRNFIILLPPNLKSGDVSRKKKTKRLDCKHGAK